jgi:recombination protein RecA
MAFAAQLRQQIEASLAGRAAGARLALAPRLVAPGYETGYDTLDAVLRGGLPVSGTSEITGTRSSGRTSIAMAYLAERTREGHVCAWIDVSGELSPEAALADGIDLDRVLWIRCSGAPEPISTPVSQVSKPQPVPGMHVVDAAFPEAKPNLRPYNPTRRTAVGTPGAPNRPLASPQRTVQVATDRQPSRRGNLVLRPRAVPERQKAAVTQTSFVKARKPWSRLEQAIKSVDLLVQAGGFGAIVLDLGSIAPQFARRIPLATWFRWRAALERTRSSLIVLSQMGCSGSAAELVLRVQADLPAPGTVMTGIPYRLEIVRRRFSESAPASASTGKRKPPQSASAWETRAPWMSYGAGS